MSVPSKPLHAVSFFFALVLIGVACAGGEEYAGGTGEPGDPRIAAPQGGLVAGGDDDDDGGAPSPAPASTPIRFVALGDTGTGSSSQIRVADAIREKCAADGCDFGILLGDNFYPSGVTSAEDPQWSPKFEVPYERVGIPFYAVLGNHDYGNSGAGTDYTRGVHQVAYSAQHPDTFRMPAAHYAVDVGPVTFLGTDTNLIHRNHDGAPAKQTEFFRNAIAASRLPWRIALAHHPYLSNGKHGNAGDYDGNEGSGSRVKAFYENALCGSVDLFLAGHDHSLQVLPGSPSCPGTFVISGAGSSATSLPGSNPARFESVDLGFFYIEADETSLRLQAVNDDGEVLYEELLQR